MKQFNFVFVCVALVLAACGDSPDSSKSNVPEPATAKAEAAHSHDEVSIGTHLIGELEVALSQGHGAVEAGKEGHLVVKLPHTDGGASVVRAWIGTEDRLGSMVGKGKYDASHDDYDVHASAPKPLAENAMWWVEVKQPDGTVHIGHAEPIR